MFSKYGWMKLLKSRTGFEVANALEKIFKERRPDTLWVDKEGNCSIKKFRNL